MPVEGVRGTDLALRLLGRTRELLGSGEYWRGEALATTPQSVPCDPLGVHASRFSILGAALRARWEMREDLADAETNPVHMRQVMDALSTLAREYRSEQGGWNFACAVLDGLQTALEEYRNAVCAEIRENET